MPKIVITHAVADVERWLKFHSPARRAAGALRHERDRSRRVDGSNNVALTTDVHDMAGMQAALASPPPELAGAMERHGVIPPIAAHVQK